MLHPDASLLGVLQALEVELHQPAVRGDAARLDALIHDDFQEFGRSGACYDKNAIKGQLLSATQHARVVADNFAVRRLAPDVALLTYRSAHGSADGTLHRFTHRSSIWQRADSGWQTSFHQGTATERFAARSSAMPATTTRQDMDISRESPDQPEVIALIAELDAWQDTLYPPESRHALDLASSKQDNVLFFVARDAARHAVGCVAVVLHGTQGEIKRMYVSPACRGQGVGRSLLRVLESAASEAGCQLLQLESGPYQPAALGLYESLGYQRRGPFGDYADDPLSVFMEKALVA